MSPVPVTCPACGNAENFTIIMDYVRFCTKPRQDGYYDAVWDEGTLDFVRYDQCGEILDPELADEVFFNSEFVL